MPGLRPGIATVVGSMLVSFGATERGEGEVGQSRARPKMNMSRAMMARTMRMV